MNSWRVADICVARARVGFVAVAIGLLVSLAACAAEPAPTATRASVPITSECLGGVPQTTCDEAQNVSLAAVASSGRTPVHVWVNSGFFCPHQDCLFDPNQNFPYPVPLARLDVGCQRRDRLRGHR